MDMRDKFEALYAARMKKVGFHAFDLEWVKGARVADGYKDDDASPRFVAQVNDMWLGFQLAAAAVKRGEDIQ